MSQIPSSRWLKLNAHDPELALRVMSFATGKKRLVIVGHRSLTPQQRGQLEALGFQNTRSGIPVRERLQFSLAEFKQIFPDAAVAELPLALIHGQLVLPEQAGDRSDGAVAVRSAVKAARPLGLNHRGQTVYQGEDERFVKRSAKEAITETALASGATFLYGRTPEDIALCADGFVTEIAGGRFMRFDDLRRAAAAVSETPEDEVIYTPHMRVFQEAVEASLVRHLRKHGSRSNDAGYALARRLEEGQPNFASRTSESITRQQYSTPLSMSTAAQRILGPVEGKTILEPTIGNASLVSLLHGADIVGVDIDAKRVAQAQAGNPGARLSAGDATTMDFLALNEGRRYDAVIANPPFGGLKSPLSMHGLRITRIDHLILMRALEARADDGIGVFIVGADSVIDSKAGQVSGGSRYLFNWLADHYDTEVVEIDGGMYAKQGSSFPVRMVVVGKKGRSAEQIPDQLDVISNHEDLLSWANRMAAKGVVLDQERKAAADAAAAIADASGQALIDAEIPDGVSPGTEPLVEAPVLEALDADRSAGAIIDTDQLDADSAGTQPNETLDGDLTQRAQPSAETNAEENSYQSPYAPASNLGEPTAMIPRNMASATRAALERVANRFGDVDNFVADRLEWTLDELQTYLSPEQIDAVALSIAAAESGRGFLEGDQTGLGKGRVMASMARYAALRGRRTVFLTETPTLFTDLYRDIRDIGSEGLFTTLIVNAGVSIWDPVSGQKLVPATPTNVVNRMVMTDSVDPEYNLILGTYSQFNRDRAKSAKSHWIATAAEGASLLLDEAHNAAGESNTGENIKLAVDLAKSVTYSSATSIKQSKNVMLYSRLFPETVDISQLPETLAAGGEVLQEVLSGMLAADGVFVRREHDLSALEFQTVIDTARLDRNRDLSDRLASILELMNYLAGDINKLVNERNREIKELLEAMPESERQGNRMGAVSMNFGSRLFAIYRQFQMAIKCDLAVEQALQTLDDGEKPVFVLENTMESLLRDLVADSRPVLGDEEEIAPALTQEVELGGQMTFRDVLTRMLGRLASYSERNGYGEVVQVQVTSKEALEARERIGKLIDDFPDLPVSPLDIIRDRIQAAGYRCDELSGRKIRLQEREGAIYAVPIVERPKAHIVKDFNTGVSDALLLTGAGSTGISLHASEKFPDQRRRVMIELQSAADVNRRVQFMGRVNRKGQTSSPIIRTLSSGLIGEARPIAMQNAKLRKLSANTTSNQDNAALDRNVPDFINLIGDEVAKRYLEAHPEIAARLDIDMERDGDRMEESYFINKLTSRLVMLSNSDQEQIYESLTKEYLGIIDELNAKGLNPLRSRELDLRATCKESRIFESGNPLSTSVFDFPVYAKQIEFEEVLTPIRTKEVEARIRDGEEAVRDARINSQGLDCRAFLLKLRTALINGRDGILEGSLPERFKSVESALADKESNAVQRTNERINFLDKTLMALDVGVPVRFTGNDSEPERGVVTRIVLPQKPKDVHLTGAYELIIAVPGRNGIVTRTLYSLQSDEQFLLYAKHSASSLLPEFDKAPEGTVVRSRMLLDGNLFSAAQLGAARHLGASVIYTDEEGRRHRGVLLSKGISTRHLEEIPVRVESATLVVAMLTAHPQLSLLSTADRDKADTDQDAALMILDRGAVLTVPGTKVRGGRYFENKELVAITGEFNGTRKQMVANFPVSSLQAVASALYRSGVSLYVPARMRDAYNAVKAQLYSTQSQHEEDREPAFAPHV
ncbi:MAG: hypothetical protein EPN79_16025 [Burkholderiaceae bacterium]|nr:MAG: hypothetical protein EPN79_16025 [Burkholderiaceae bacterium]